MAKKKTPVRDMSPYQFARDDLWQISTNIWSISDYRDCLGTGEKIKTRLFYMNDDIPPTLWCLPVPTDLATIWSWIKQLITQPHTERVGAVSFHDQYSDDNLTLDVVGLIFESHADMLIFKLGMDL